MVDGYVTQTRKSDKKPGSKDPFLIKRNSASPVISGNTDYRIDETTTSFRTGMSEEPRFTSGAEQQSFLMGDRATQFVGDTGHTFKNVKTYKIPSRNRTVSLNSDQYFTGSVYVTCSNPAFMGGGALPAEPSFNESYYGNRLIVAATPTLPKSNVMQSFAELAREGFASVVGSGILKSIGHQADFFRSLGSEYLNVSFGWAPFLADLRSIIESVSKANQSILALKENDGKLVRRRRYIPEQTTSVSGTSGYDGAMYIGGSYLFSAWSDWNVSTTVPVTIIKSTSQKIWFSGAFTYKLAAEDSLIGKFERYEQYCQHLFGTRITPSVLWELAPWSWLVDWVVDIQSALQRAEFSMQDGNVMKYGYLMREITQQASFASSITFNNGFRQSYETVYRQVTKQRFRSTPFGFGLNPNSFTNRQWAILAALGLSKSPKGLF